MDILFQNCKRIITRMLIYKTNSRCMCFLIGRVGNNANNNQWNAIVIANLSHCSPFHFGTNY